MTTRCTASSRGDLDEFGQPDAEDSVIVTLAGDPLYVGVKPLEEQHRWPTSACSRRSSRAARSSAIGKNYAAHAAEMGSEVPTEPLMFLKPNTAVIGPGDPIFYPPPVAATCTSRASSPS